MRLTTIFTARTQNVRIYYYSNTEGDIREKLWKWCMSYVCMYACNSAVELRLMVVEDNARLYFIAYFSIIFYMTVACTTSLHIFTSTIFLEQSHACTCTVAVYAHLLIFKLAVLSAWKIYVWRGPTERHRYVRGYGCSMMFENSFPLLHVMSMFLFDNIDVASK